VVAIQMLTGLGPRQHTGAPDGVLKPLLDGLTEPEPEQRIPSASAALELLRRLGVPPGAPWQDDPEPPEVFDQLGQVEVPSEVASMPSYAGPRDPDSQAAAVGAPGRGTPSGEIDTEPSQHSASVTTRSQATIILTIVCFLAAIGLSAAALILIFQ
jgi:serine/threonine-protein kinase